MIVTCVKCQREGMDLSMRNTKDGCVCFLCSPEGASLDVVEAMQDDEGTTLYAHSNLGKLHMSVISRGIGLHLRVEDGQFSFWGGRRTKALKETADV